MNILYISNQTASNKRIGNPIVLNLIEQINTKQEHSADFLGFCWNILRYFRKIKNLKKKYDIIHIQFGGLYSLLAIFPFIFCSNALRLITFHGTDIHATSSRKNKLHVSSLKMFINKTTSLISFPIYKKIGFVSKSLIKHVPDFWYRLFQKKIFIHHLGVNYDVFYPIEQLDARKLLNISPSKTIFLFSSVSSNKVKRYDRAYEIVDKLGISCELLVMSNIPRDKVPYYIAACDYLLITSDEEGSPNIVREALAMNKPVISVDVGDVKEQINRTKKSFIIDFQPEIAINQIREKLDLSLEENTRQQMMSYISSDFTTERILRTYKELLNI